MVDFTLHCYDQTRIILLKLPHHILNLILRLYLRIVMRMRVLGRYIEKVNHILLRNVLLPFIEVTRSDPFLKLVNLVKYLLPVTVTASHHFHFFERLPPTPETRTTHQIIPEPLQRDSVVFLLELIDPPDPVILQIHPNIPGSLLQVGKISQ